MIDKKYIQELADLLSDVGPVLQQNNHLYTSAELDTFTNKGNSMSNNFIPLVVNIFFLFFLI